MKPLRKHTTFGHRRNPAEPTLEGSARRAFGTARSKGISVKTKLYRATHGEFHYPSWRPTKIQAIGLIVLLAIGTLFLADQNLKGPFSVLSGKPGGFIDPNTIIWQGTNPNRDIAEFNVKNFQQKTNFVDSTDTLESTRTIASQSYPTTNYDADSASLSAGYEIGQCFTSSITGSLSLAKFYLKEAVNVAGTATARLYATTGTVGTSCIPSGSALATSDTFDLANIVNPIALYSLYFTGSNMFSVVSGTAYAIAIHSETVTSSSYNAGADGSSPTDTGNIYSCFPSPCTAFSTQDLIYEVDVITSTTSHSVAISKAQVGDLSVASGKTLGFNFTWAATSTQTNLEFGVFLTVNATLPTQNGWDPYSDQSVLYLLKMKCTASCSTSSATILFKEYFVKTLGQQHTIASEDSGCASGSSYMCSSVAVNPTPASAMNYVQTLLNYTGGTHPLGSACVFGAGAYGGPNCSWLSVGDTITFTPSTQISRVLPHFQFQAQQYYLGFYQLPSASMTVEFGFQMGTEGYLSIYTQNSGSPVATPPNIDTGGFFGPIIKALINLGVWMFQQLLLSIAVIAAVVEIAGNALGNFFGLGNLGTALVSFLSGVANFVANVFTTVFGWSVTFASLFAGSIAVFSNFIGGSFGFVTWIISWFTSLSGIWQIIQDFWTAVNTVVLSMNAILVFYYIIGMFMVYMDGWKGFKEWLEIGETFTLKLIKLGWWIGNEMRTVILDIKQLIVNWL